MHILVVHQYYLRPDEAGGSRWNQFARYWGQSGHKITILAGTVNYATGEKHPDYKGTFIVTEHDGPNVTIKRCHVSRTYNRSFLGRAWAYSSFTFSSTIAGLLAETPNIIICSSPPLTVGLTGALLSSYYRAPMIFEVRDLWPESAIDTAVLTNKWAIKFGYWLESFCYRHAAWINVLTPAFAESLVNKKAVSPSRLSIIPNGADLDLLQPGPRHNWVRQKYRLHNKFVVTYVGAHGRANHLIQLLQAARLLKDKDPHVQLLLIGAGMQKPMLVEQARSWTLDNVTFLDPVAKEQIGPYLHASNACTAVLKKVDTFKTVYPNKLFDYMAVAKPVIIAIDGAARRLVESARAGHYVEPENPHAFVQAVLKLKNNPHAADQMGRRGRKYVAANFSRQHLAQQYLQIITKIASDKTESL